MSQTEDRILVYIALAVICAFIGVFGGLVVAGLTFLQVAAVIEALFWFGLPTPGASRYRRQRILFNS